MTEIGEPLSDFDRGNLIRLLSKVKPNTLLGISIDIGLKNARPSRVIRELSVQAVDSPLDMVAALGLRITILLLLAYPKD